MKTPTLITKTILLVIVLCSFSTVSFAQVRTPIRTNSGNQNPIEKQMLEKAKSLNLGAVHSESASMRPTAGSGGYFLRFEKGWVYYNPNTKQVYAIYGDIMNKWAETGYEVGELGFPTSDEKDSDRKDWKRMNTFDKGTIYWNDGNLEVVKKTKIAAVVNRSNKISYSFAKSKIDKVKLSGTTISLISTKNSQNSYSNKVTRVGNEKEDGDKICKKEYRTLSVTNINQDVLNPDDIADLRIGGIYDFNEFNKGNPNLIDAPRNPITISVAGLKSVTVKNPTPEALFDANSEILNQRFASRPVGGGQLLEQKTVNSATELNIAAGVSYKSGLYNASAKFGYNEKSQSNKFLVTYTYPIFTIQKTSGNNYFTNKTFNTNPNYVILDKITYGVKLLVFYESELSQKELDAAFTGSAWKINASLDINTKRKLEETTFKVFLYGSSDAVQTIKGYDQLFSETNRMLRAIVDANKTSPLELGAPISYSLKFLNGDTAATNCNANEISSQVCVPNSNISMKLTVNLNCVKTSDYGFYGWNDAEIVDESGNPIQGTKNFFDFGKKANSGSTCDQIDTNSMNNPYKYVEFNNLSKEEREKGTLRLWFWINNGDQGNYCPILGSKQQKNNSRGGNHYFVDFKLKDIMLPQKDGKPTTKEVTAQADSGKRTVIKFNYSFIWTK